MNATEWFDQFPELENKDAWPSDSQWCPRHWAPCPLLGANGVGASLELIRHWLGQSSIPPNQTELLNMQQSLDSPLCCKFGDEYMYELWGKWPPTKVN